MKNLHSGCLSRVVAVGLAVGLMATGCRKKTTPDAVSPSQLALTPLAAARPFAVAAVTISGLEGTLDRLGAFAKDLGLPFDKNDARTWATSQSPRGAAAADKLDLQNPMGLAMVASPKPKADALIAVAFALKDGSPKGFADFITFVGKVKSRDKDAVEIAPVADGGTEKGMWLLTRTEASLGPVVLAAESREALVAAGTLALEARRTATDDLQVTAWPEGIARTQGTDLATFVAESKTKMRTALSHDVPGGPALVGIGLRTIDAMLDGVTQLSDIRLGLSLDKTRGLSLKTVVAAKPGTGLAGLFGPGKPYALEPQLLAGPSPAAIGALGNARFTKPFGPLFRSLIETLAPAGIGRDKALSAFDTLTRSLAGPWSAALRMEDGAKFGIAYDIIYPLEPGVSGSAVLAAMNELIQGSLMTGLMKTASPALGKSKISSKMEADTLVVRFLMDLGKLPAKARQGLDQIPGFDGSALEARAAVTADKLFMVLGSGAVDRLAALRGKPSSVPPVNPVLAAALSETKNDESLSFLDFGAIVRPALSLLGGMNAGDNPSLGMMTMLAPLLANASLAMYSSYRGSPEGLVLSWRIPAATFSSVAALFRAFAGGGAPPAGK